MTVSTDYAAAHVESLVSYGERRIKHHEDAFMDCEDVAMLRTVAAKLRALDAIFKALGVKDESGLESLETIAILQENARDLAHIKTLCVAAGIPCWSGRSAADMVLELTTTLTSKRAKE